MATTALLSWVGTVLLYLIRTGLFRNIIYCVNFYSAFSNTMMKFVSHFVNLIYIIEIDICCRFVNDFVNEL